MDPLILIIEELHRARSDVEKYETDLSEYEARPDFNHKNARYNRLLLEKDLVLRNLCDLRMDLSKKATDLKGNAIYAREEDGATRYFLDRAPSNASLSTTPNIDTSSESLQSYPHNSMDSVTLPHSYSHQAPSPAPLAVPAPAVTKISSARRAHAHSLNVSSHAAPYTQQTQLAQVTQLNNQILPTHSLNNSINNNSSNLYPPAPQAQPQTYAQQQPSVQTYNVQPQGQAYGVQQPQTAQYTQPHSVHTSFTTHNPPNNNNSNATYGATHNVISSPAHMAGASYVITSPAGYSGPPTQRRPDPTDLPDLPKYLAAKADLSAIMRDFTDNKIHFVGVDNHVIAMAEYQNISKFTKSGEDPAKFMKGEYRSYKTGYVKKTNSYTENKLFFPVFHPYAPQHISGML